MSVCGQEIFAPQAFFSGKISGQRERTHEKERKENLKERRKQKRVTGRKGGSYPIFDSLSDCFLVLQQRLTL